MKYQLTPEEIQERIAYLAVTDLDQAIRKLNDIIKLSEKLKVSMRGRRVNELAVEVRDELAQLQAYLCDYPIEEERSNEVIPYG